MSEQPFILLITRPAPTGERFASGLSDQAQTLLTPLYAPVMRIDKVETSLSFEALDGLILSSGNAVRALAATSPSVPVPIYCVGSETARKATQQGWQARAMGKNADALVQAICAMRPSGRLLHLRGAHARGEIAQRLNAAGIKTDEKVIYTQESVDWPTGLADQLDLARVTIAPVFSPRSADLLAQRYPGSKSLYLVALSAAVADRLQRMERADLRICGAPNAGAMAELVEELVEKHCRVEGYQASQ